MSGVTTLLNAMGIPFTTSGDTHVMVSCWSKRHHSHMDRHPSLSIRTIPPYTVYCHKAGCVYNTGVMAHCGVERAVSAHFILDPAIKKVLSRLNDLGQLYVPRIVLAADYTNDIMAMSKNVMPPAALAFLASKGVTQKGIQAYKLLWDVENEGVVFPVMSGGRCVGAQIRPISGTGLKYWARFPFKARKYWFGSQFARKITGKKVVITEGPLDCIHISEFGVPCMASMGSGVGQEKVHVLKVSIRPSKVLVLMDPDEGGVGIAKALMRHLVAAGIPCCNLVSTVDPKELSLDDFRKLLK